MPDFNVNPMTMVTCPHCKGQFMQATVSLGAPTVSVPYQVAEEFYPWQCEKCGRYHYKKFPDDGCDWCKGENINRRMQESREASDDSARRIQEEDRRARAAQSGSTLSTPSQPPMISGPPMIPGRRYG